MSVQKDQIPMDAVPLDPCAGPGGNRSYPDPAVPLGRAWQDVWNALRECYPGGLPGPELAERVAPRHGLAVSTLRVLLARGAGCGVLESTRGSFPGDPPPEGPASHEPAKYRLGTRMLERLQRERVAP